MEKNSKIGLTAGAFMACSGAASAATISQTLSFNSTPTWSSTFSFEGANTLLPTGAKLTGVSIQLIESLGSFYVLTNSSGVSGTASLQITDVASIGLPSPIGTPFTSTDVGSTSSETVDSGDLAILGSVGSNTQSSMVFTTGLSGFLTGFTAGITDTTTVTFEAQGFIQEIAQRSGEANATLTYTYTAVPEPTTMTLIGIGLTSLAARRARKKKDRLVG
jgi:hypothetical protein